MTCDIWDTDYNSDNWEAEYMTIFVTWHWTAFASLAMFGFQCDWNWQCDNFEAKPKRTRKNRFKLPPLHCTHVQPAAASWVGGGCLPGSSLLQPTLSYLSYILLLFHLEKYQDIVSDDQVVQCTTWSSGPAQCNCTLLWRCSPLMAIF